MALDTARFDDQGATSAVVNLAVTLPVTSVTIDSSFNYTFTGVGRITGNGNLTKTNSGTLVMLTDIVAYTLDVGLDFKELLLGETCIDRRAELLLEHLGTLRSAAFPPEFSVN